MLLAPRTSSDAIPGTPLPATAVTAAPHIIARNYEEVLLQTTSLQGRKSLQPETVKAESVILLYFGDVNAILAVNGRIPCPDLFCNGPE